MSSSDDEKQPHEYMAEMLDGKQRKRSAPAKGPATKQSKLSFPPARAKAPVDDDDDLSDDELEEERRIAEEAKEKELEFLRNKNKDKDVLEGPKPAGSATESKSASDASSEDKSEKKED